MSELEEKNEDEHFGTTLYYLFPLSQSIKYSCHAAKPIADAESDVDDDNGGKSWR